MPPAAAATPGAAPAAPAPPTPPPSSAPPSPPSAPLSDAFSQLDSFMDSDDSGGPPSTPPATPSGGEPAKPSPAAGTTPSQPKPATPPTAQKPSEPPKPADKPYDIEKDMSRMPKQMRQAYDQLKAKTKELEAKVSELSQAKPVADDPEKKALSERLTERERRLQELETERKFVDYERSDDYKKDYYQPYVDAFQAARDRVSGLTVTADGEERMGTSQDFDNLMRIGDENAAVDYATEVFGSKAPLVLMHREKILDLNTKRVKAIDEYKSMGADREKQRNEQFAKENEALSGMFKKAVQAAHEKYPQWFKPTEGDNLDPKINEALENGYKLVDQLYNENNLTNEQRALLHAAVRNKAGAFDRVALELRNARKQLSELQARLDSYEKSEPGGGVRRAAAKGELDWEAQLDALQS